MLEAELFSLLNRTADAAFVVAEGGEILSWNKSAERLFGYSAGQAVHQTCDALLDGLGTLGTKVCTHGCTVQHYAADSQEIPDFDLQVRTNTGARLWLNVSTIIFEEPRLNRRLVVHLARDISRHKRNKEILGKILAASQELTAGSGDCSGVAPVAPLSEQERRILRLFAKGNDSAEIGRELDITLPTLRNHLHSINEKLGTHNRLEAVMHAIHRGLI
jgi:PAS domain S-box-containing protein